MAADPRLFCRVDAETKKQFDLYTTKKDTSVQKVLEGYVHVLLELEDKITPDEALDAIRERAKQKPGDE
ncbi:hypothetical protein EDC32_1011255 [Laceyella sacchari]|uniref:hypothetical protein n=1 Tax=Laceyella sacchari TaxID=37482 RepID=UPI00104B61B6|nr:hypothetical protein [Laceyella sacchari]TCW41589.1 hypothetical protein EDC32_1011255 [Laceyella sacchari]